MTHSLLDSIPAPLLQGGLEIAARLKASGFESYFAGGVVRDLLLGRPVADIDIATAAPPAEIERLFPKTIAVGREFGVVVVLVGSAHYEVATFRSESEYLDGRHPSSVQFTDARQDALRRDFTVNALFLDPFSGQLIDHVGGQTDLEKGLIRTVGLAADRFQEDKLRVLRAVRFACQLKFDIEAETFSQVRAFAPTLTQVSWERIRDEILKAITGPAPARALALLSDVGILEVLLPEVAAMRGLQQPPEFHPEGDVFEHTRLMFEFSSGLDATLAFGILLHDVGKPLTFSVRERIRFDRHDEVGAEVAWRVCRRLRLSNEQTDEIVDLVRNHLRFIPVREMRDSTLKRLLRKSNIEKHLELHRLDCLASHGDLSSYHFCRGRLKELNQGSMRPPPLLSGHDLIELGLAPGPLFSEILHALEDLQLEGHVVSKDDATAWVKRQYVDREPQV